MSELREDQRTAVDQRRAIAKGKPALSELEAGEWNMLEQALAHGIAIGCIRNGVRVPNIAAALAAYRQRMIARLERARGDATGLELDRALQDLRDGRIGP